METFFQGFFCLYLLIAKGFTEVYKGLKGILFW